MLGGTGWFSNSKNRENPGGRPEKIGQNQRNGFALIKNCTELSVAVGPERASTCSRSNKEGTGLRSPLRHSVSNQGDELVRRALVPAQRAHLSRLEPLRDACPAENVAARRRGGVPPLAEAQHALADARLGRVHILFVIVFGLSAVALLLLLTVLSTALFSVRVVAAVRRRRRG